MQIANIPNIGLDQIVTEHAKWLASGGDDGARAELYEADLRGVNLYNADLRHACMSKANLAGANLCKANLSNASIRSADLRDANLSGVIGLLSPYEWLKEHFEATEEGWIVFRAQYGYFKSPSPWRHEPGAVLTEVCHPDRTIDCACGVSFATLDWMRKKCFGDFYWRCLIPWSRSCGIVVPYNTDGKARCDYLQLLEIVK